MGHINAKIGHVPNNTLFTTQDTNSIIGLCSKPHTCVYRSHTAMQNIGTQFAVYCGNYPVKRAYGLRHTHSGLMRFGTCPQYSDEGFKCALISEQDVWVGTMEWSWCLGVHCGILDLRCSLALYSKYGVWYGTHQQCTARCPTLVPCIWNRDMHVT